MVQRVDPGTGLTALQLAFALAYTDQPLDQRNATQALRDCGYKHRSEKALGNHASQLLNHPAVKGFIERFDAKIVARAEEEAAISKSQVLSRLWEEANDGKKIKALDKEGKTVEVVDTNPGARVAACREINAMLGYNAPQEIKRTGVPDTVIFYVPGDNENP